jgi:hypothetical protein
MILVDDEQTPCSFEFMADSATCQDCDLYLECLDTYEYVFANEV